MTRTPNWTNEALLERAEELSGRRRHADVAKLLCHVLDERSLPTDLRSKALRLRAEAWLGIGRERRAWHDLQELRRLGQHHEWAILQQARLRARHGERDSLLPEVLAIARRDPTSSLGWRVAKELSANTPRLGLEAEITIALARSDRTDIPVTCRASAMLARRGEHDAALELLRQARSTNSDDAEMVTRARAALLLERGDHLALVEELQKLSAHTVDDRLWQSHAWLTAGHADRALAELQDSALSAVGQRDNALRLETVRLLCRLGRLDEARAEASTNSGPPGDADLVVMAANGAWQSVAALADRSWLRPESLVLVGEALRRTGRPLDAKPVLQRAQQLSHGASAPMLLNRFAVRATRYLASACLEAFEPMFNEPRPPQPADNAAWLHGQVDALLDRLGGTRDHLLSWVAPDGRLLIHKPHLDIKSELAILRQSIGDLGLEGTISRHSEVISRRGEHPTVYTFRAELHLWAGNADAAEQDLKRALSLDVDTRWAYVGLAIVHLLRTDPTRALDVLDEGIARMGKLPSAPPFQGEALLQMERWSEAEERLLTGLKWRPSRVSSWVLIAICRLRRHKSVDSIVESIAGQYRDLWSASTGEDLEARLRSVLGLMRGNRASGMLTWYDPRGWWRTEQARVLIESPQVRRP